MLTRPAHPITTNAAERFAAAPEYIETPASRAAERKAGTARAAWTERKAAADAKAQAKHKADARRKATAERVAARKAVARRKAPAKPDAKLLADAKRREGRRKVGPRPPKPEHRRAVKAAHKAQVAQFAGTGQRAAEYVAYARSTYGVRDRMDAEELAVIRGQRARLAKALANAPDAPANAEQLADRAAALLASLPLFGDELAQRAAALDMLKQAALSIRTADAKAELERLTRRGLALRQQLGRVWATDAERALAQTLAADRPEPEFPARSLGPVAPAVTVTLYDRDAAARKAKAQRQASAAAAEQYAASCADTWRRVNRSVEDQGLADWFKRRAWRAKREADRLAALAAAPAPAKPDVDAAEVDALADAIAEGQAPAKGDRRTWHNEQNLPDSGDLLDEHEDNRVLALTEGGAPIGWREAAQLGIVVTATP